MPEKRLVILDSGAFSAWSKNAVINLDHYINFCLKWPSTSYYVNLDVIPGKPNDKASCTDEVREQSAFIGWSNYLHMLKSLPIEKVIPVFHWGESFKWLEKYLRFGCPYIGISPANDTTTRTKATWMNTLRKYVLSPTDGKPVVKMHGFAVTSFDLMKYWAWHSVDSAAWVQQGGFGKFWVPIKTNGIYDYSESPFLVGASPMSPSKETRGVHLLTMSPMVLQHVKDYLKQEEVELGEYDVYTCKSDHKPIKGKELWYDATKHQMLRILKEGVITSNHDRKMLNARFLLRANRVLPVRNIYFAGSSGFPTLEKILKNRLFSFETFSSDKGSKTFREHLGWVEEYQKSLED